MARAPLLNPKPLTLNEYLMINGPDHQHRIRGYFCRGQATRGSRCGVVRDDVEENLEDDFTLRCVGMVDEPVEERRPAEVVNLVCRQWGEEER